jgi:mRNA-degrading endonuclease RelE of RelBE toxin-antitoxin system
VVYKSSVGRDIRHLDPGNARRILSRISSDLADDSIRGQPLQGEFRGLFRIRIGEYRVIYAFVGEDILVLRIGPGSNVYSPR